MFLKNTMPGQLHDIAKCHAACFPESLSTKLGPDYLRKSMEWFLAAPNRFLFHVQNAQNVIGYCGGFVPQYYGDGSSSGMLQYAFKEAVVGIIKHPWLVFHPEVMMHYRFIWLNIKRKITRKSIPLEAPKPDNKRLEHVGLVVIGVHPDCRGNGVADLLMNEFENKAKSYDKHELLLTVKRANGRAIKAYKKFGWNILSEQQQTYVMNKII